MRKAEQSKKERVPGAAGAPQLTSKVQEHPARIALAPA